MRTSRFRGLAVASAIVLALASPGRLAAQVALVPGGPWELFEWFLGVGPVEGSGFTVSSVAQEIRLRVTDSGVSGDAFDVFVNGSVFATPSVPPSVFTGAFTGADAWAHPALSKRELVLAPGSYTITLNVRETAPGFDFGEGFIRADLVQTGVIPEPASVLLLATGLGGVGLVARRRRR